MRAGPGSGGDEISRPLRRATDSPLWIQLRRRRQLAPAFTVEEAAPRVPRTRWWAGWVHSRRASMHPFIDPRTSNGDVASKPAPRTTTQADELTELHALCRDGRLYDVERWISDGRPLQAAGGTPSGRATSALTIAIEAGNHSLVRLLLSNGYDANQEAGSPLDLPLRARRFDLVQLLLVWGADPHRVDLSDVFGTYRSYCSRNSTNWALMSLPVTPLLKRWRITRATSRC